MYNVSLIKFYKFTVCFIMLQWDVANWERFFFLCFEGPQPTLYLVPLPDELYIHPNGYNCRNPCLNLTTPLQAFGKQIGKSCVTKYDAYSGIIIMLCKLKGNKGMGNKGGAICLILHRHILKAQKHFCVAQSQTSQWNTSLCSEKIPAEKYIKHIKQHWRTHTERDNLCHACSHTKSK